MAFQADGVGVITVTTFNATGDFSIEFPPFSYTLPGNQVLVNTEGSSQLTIISDGRIKLVFGSSEEYVLTIPNIEVGDLIDDLVITRTGGSGTISANGSSQSFSSATTFRINQMFGTVGGSYNYRGKFESGTLNFIVGGNNGAATYDFSAESGTTLIDTSGAQTAGVLNGFTTGGFVANGEVTEPEATTSTLNIDMSDALPASGALITRVLTIAGDSILYAGEPIYTDGAFSVDLPIATVPVGTLVDWVAYDVTGEEVAGARQATEATEV